MKVKEALSICWQNEDEFIGMFESPGYGLEQFNGIVALLQMEPLDGEIEDGFLEDHGMEDFENQSKEND